MANWYSNGQGIESVPISDRGFQYGDGLFETVAIRNGDARLWSFHFERLSSGCDRIGLAPPKEADLLAGIDDALRQGDVLPAYCTVKIVVTAGSGVRGYGRKAVTSPPVYFGCFASTPPTLRMLEDGVDIPICNSRLSLNAETAGLKTLNRLDQVLARSELVERGFFEGLTMDAEDNIICGTMSNVFFVSGNSIVTPALDQCGVTGVMRRHVVDVLRDEGRHVDVRRFPLSELGKVDEVFFSNSQFGILPVAHCSEYAWGVGPNTREIMRIAADAGIAECRL